MQIESEKKVPYIMPLKLLKLFAEKKKTRKKIHQYVSSGNVGGRCMYNYFLIVIYSFLYILT